MGFMRPLPKDSLVTNLRMLLAKTGMSVGELASKSGVSKRMIDYILAGERKATIPTAEKLAEPFGLSGWQLIMPNLPYELARNGKLDRLIDSYEHSNDATRGYVDSVLERERKEGNGK
jgi:transcriptional regulator with XRE-family HTH domain